MPRKPDDLITKRVAALASAKPPPAGAMEKSLRKKSRGQDRQTIFRFGRVINGRGEEYACILRDISDTGARVVFEGEPGLLPTVILKIELTGEIKRAKVVWQKGRDAGLSFE
ncbi:MAG: PilZ domain-containing protein [Parvularculaceae bacterium]